MGFALGIVFGVGLAMAIVRFRVMEMSVMPWAIISQTIPIVALAPMILVVSSQLGIEGRDIPKAIIAAYLSFFPVLVSMVKGLRSPDQMQLDLLKTYGASEWQTFFKLRHPGLDALFLRLAEGGDRGQPGRHHRRGIADRGDRGPGRADADRVAVRRAA